MGILDIMPQLLLIHSLLIGLVHLFMFLINIMPSTMDLEKSDLKKYNLQLFSDYERSLSLSLYLSIVDKLSTIEIHASPPARGISQPAS